MNVLEELHKMKEEVDSNITGHASKHDEVVESKRKIEDLLDLYHREASALEQAINTLSLKKARAESMLTIQATSPSPMYKTGPSPVTGASTTRF